MTQLTPIPESSPLVFNVPIGPYEIVAIVNVTGTNRQNVELSFTGSGVPFVPVNAGALPIFLTPQNVGIPTNILANQGPQSLNIQNLVYTPPGINTAGKLVLTCVYSNQQGTGGWSFSNTIATWLIMGSMPTT